MKIPRRNHSAEFNIRIDREAMRGVAVSYQIKRWKEAREEPTSLRLGSHLFLYDRTKKDEWRSATGGGSVSAML